MSHYKISDHTADEWMAMAHGEHRVTNESFDRCDTDGFLTQAVHQAKAHTYSSIAKYRAEGREDGDVQSIAWPFMLIEDEWVPAPFYEWRRNQYGTFVRIFGNVPQEKRFWNPSTAASMKRAQANDTKKGIRWGRVWAEVRAEVNDAWSGYVVVRAQQEGAVRSVITDCDYAEN